MTKPIRMPQTISDASLSGGKTGTSRATNSVAAPMTVSQPGTSQQPSLPKTSLVRPTSIDATSTVAPQQFVTQVTVDPSTNLSSTDLTQPLTSGSADQIIVDTTTGELQFADVNVVVGATVYQANDIYITAVSQRTYNQTIKNTTINNSPAGNINGEIQFYKSGNFSADSGLTYNDSTDVLSLAGGLITGNILINGNSVLGSVDNVTIYGGTNGQYLQTDGAGNLNWSTTTTGTVTSIGITSNNLTVSGGPITTNGNINVDLPSNVSFGRVTTSNLTVGTITANNGNGNIVVSNNIVTSGNITFSDATVQNTAWTGAVAGANVSGQVGNALVAGRVYTNSQPNITSVGTLLGLGVTGNVNITGNINVTGNLNYSNVTDLVVGDPLIYIGANNPGDIYDLGIVASYTTSEEVHTGLARDHTDGTWKLFDGLANEPTTVIDFANATYAPLLAGNITSTGTIAANDLVVNNDIIVSGDITGTGASPGPRLSGFDFVGTANANIGQTLNVVGNTNVNILRIGAIPTPAGTSNLLLLNSSNYATYDTSINYDSATDTLNTANIAASGNITAGNLTSNGSLAVTGTSNLGAVGNITITGGTSGQVLTTNGSGGLSWAASSINAAGTTSSIQYNVGGALTGDSNLSYNTTTGYFSVLGNIRQISIGSTANAFANGTIANTIAIGANSAAVGDHAVSIGANSNAYGASSSIAIGKNARSANVAVGIGENANVSGQGTIGIGFGANVSGANAIGIGAALGSQVSGEGAVAMGYGANAGSTDNTVTIGANSRTSGSSANAVAVGYLSAATSLNAIAIGSNANASSTNAISIGSNTLGTFTNGVTIGAGSSTNGSGAVVAGTLGTATSNAVAVGIAAAASGFGGVAVGAGATGSDTGVVAIGQNSNASSLGAISIGNASVANSNFALAIGEGAIATSNVTISFGQASRATGFGTIAIGNTSNASGSNAIAIGGSANASGSNATSMGRGASSTGAGAVAIGPSASAINSNTIAMGNSASASGESAVSIGESATAGFIGAIAIGSGAQATSTNSVAIGTGAVSNAANTIVLGTSTLNTNVAGSLTVTGTSNLGAVGNVTITGGSSGQYLQTNGSGTLTWATVNTAVANVANGTSNLNIPVADGNVNISSAGNANVLVVTGTGANITGTLNATGNANLGNLGVTGIVNFTQTSNVALGAVGNVSIAGGTSGQVLTTDGSGVLSWATPTISNIANGNSNVSIAAANGNVAINSAGNTIATFSGTTTTINGNLIVTGNAILPVSVRYNNVAGLASNTFLTANSQTYQEFANATAVQTIVYLPNAMTLSNGARYTISANSDLSAGVVVRGNANSTIGTVSSYDISEFILLNNSNANGVWQRTSVGATSSTSYPTGSSGTGPIVRAFSPEFDQQIRSSSTNMVLIPVAGNISLGGNSTSNLWLSNANSTANVHILDGQGGSGAGTRTVNIAANSTATNANVVLNVGTSVNNVTTNLHGTVNINSDTDSSRLNVTGTANIGTLNVTGNVTTSFIGNANSYINFPAADGNINVSAGLHANGVSANSSAAVIMRSGGGNIDIYPAAGSGAVRLGAAGIPNMVVVTLNGASISGNVNMSGNLLVTNGSNITTGSGTVSGNIVTSTAGADLVRANNASTGTLYANIGSAGLNANVEISIGATTGNGNAITTFNAGGSSANGTTTVNMNANTFNISSSTVTTFSGNIGVGGAINATGNITGNFTGVIARNKLDNQTVGGSSATVSTALTLVATSGTVNITLPSTTVSNIGEIYYVTDTLGSNRTGNSITVSPVGGGTIIGQSSVQITQPYNSLSLVCTGANVWGLL